MCVRIILEVSFPHETDMAAFLMRPRAYESVTSPCRPVASSQTPPSPLMMHKTAMVPCYSGEGAGRHDNCGSAATTDFSQRSMRHC